jgi:hypothetical protein
VTPIEEHTALVAAVTEMLRVAEAATPGPWIAGGIGDYGWSVQFGDAIRQWANSGIETEDNEQGKTDATFIAAHDPTWAVAVHREALERLNRHRPRDESLYCRGHGQDWYYPWHQCPEVAGLRSVYITGGIEV